MLFGVVLISGVVGGAYGEDAPLGVVVGLITASCLRGLPARDAAGEPGRPAGGPGDRRDDRDGRSSRSSWGTLMGDFDPVPAWPAHGYLLLLGVTSQSIGYLFIRSRCRGCRPRCRR